jgi:hypothetical protein
VKLTSFLGLTSRLKYIGEQKLVQGIQHKLLVKLMGYNYKIEYKKEKKIG